MKRNSIAVFVMVITVLCSGCSRDEGAEVFSPIDREFSSDVELDPSFSGYLHNEILREFDKRHSFLRDRLPSRREFIDINHSIINKVLSENGIDFQFSKREIVEFVTIVEKYIREGVIRTDYGRDLKLEDCLALSDAGLIAESSARRAHELYTIVRKNVMETPRTVATEVDQVCYDKCKYDNDDAIFVSIAESSTRYWQSYYISVVDTTTANITQVIMEKVGYMLNNYGADTVAGVIMAYMTSGSSFVIQVVSGGAFSALASEICNWCQDNGGWYDWGENFPIIP